jgi:hypothetical protein
VSPTYGITASPIRYQHPPVIEKYSTDFLTATPAVILFNPLTEIEVNEPNTERPFSPDVAKLE